ncbi:hypothetical protein [Bradyrhizobium canariense]|uniref:hypothetical protein n=1 Tax=Bradyrhizobium canariense TaxID=255045 RepID=UPI001430E198|nr:hypothetical protein [Bradyrhizobium canariense]
MPNFSADKLYQVVCVMHFSRSRGGVAGRVAKVIAGNCGTDGLNLGVISAMPKRS